MGFMQLCFQFFVSSISSIVYLLAFLHDSFPSLLLLLGCPHCLLLKFVLRDETSNLLAAMLARCLLVAVRL